MARNRRIIPLRRRQHECEVTQERRQDFVQCSFERRRFPPTPTIGHTELVVADWQGGEARAVPGAIRILGLDDEMRPVVSVQGEDSVTVGRGGWRSRCGPGRVLIGVRIR